MIDPHCLEEWPEFVRHSLARPLVGTAEWSGQLAGQTVKVVASNAQLLQWLTRPLAHLQQASQAPEGAELEIEIHSQPTSASPGEVYFQRSPDHNYAFQWLPHSQSALARREKRLIVRASDPARLSLYELGRPFHAMLSLWAQEVGRQIVHAGLVARGNRGLLIGGDSGQGKSTLALACLRAGFKFLGDDLCLLGADNIGYSLYSTTFLKPEARAQWPELGPEALAPRFPWEEKTLTYLHPGQAASLASKVAIAAVLLPGPEGQRLSPLTPMQALRRLAPSTLLTGPLTAGKAGLEQLTGLVQSRPCFHLPWSCDPAETVSGLLDSLK